MLTTPSRQLPRAHHAALALAILVAALVAATPSLLHASGEGHTAAGSGHAAAVGPVLLGLVIILIAAKFGGHLAARIRQPAVLGELVIGVVLGNLVLLGYDGIEWIKHNDHIRLLAELGVLILLFEAGLESTVRDMMRVGVSSLVVALLGVVTPFVLGYFVSELALPEASVYVHIFLGATLTATSVGITARVLQDLGKSKTNEAKIILGAAVIDDVLGLVILSVVTGLIAAANAGTQLSYGSIGLILGKAAVFLFGALILGLWLSPKLFSFASRLRASGVLLVFSLSVCFILAYISGQIGLAPIVGAFAAGLILEDVHYKKFTDRGEQTLEHHIEPISSFLVPIFFVVMGLDVDISAFASAEIIGLAAVLTAVAIAGKQACSFGAFGKGLDRISIGLGMVPRGEVGLIFAGIGAGLSVNGEPVINDGEYSAVVMMVIITTMVTPPALKWSLSRRRHGASA